MGEEQKKKEGEEEKAKQEEEQQQVKKEEDKKEKEEEEEDDDESQQEIVLKVEMHCEACARKVARSLKGFSGVEDVTVDCKASKVVVKGKSADPIKVSERIQKKSGRKVEIVSPLPNRPPEENKDAPPPPPPPEKKEEPPVVKTMVLKVQMHCEACAQVLQKRIKKIKGVESVTTDLASNEVTVNGFIEPDKLVSDLYKRTRKHAILVKNEETKLEEEKKEEGGDDQKKEEKKPEEEEKKDAKEKDESKVEVKKSEYWAPKNYMEYYGSTSYPPQFFSDENPNACLIM